MQEVKRVTLHALSKELVEVAGTTGFLEPF